MPIFNENPTGTNGFDPSRRRFIRVAFLSAAAASTVGLRAYASGDSDETGEESSGTAGESGESEGYVVVLTWGGAYTEAEADTFYRAYTEETGFEVQTVTPVEFAKYRAAVETGVYEFDLGVISESDAWRAHQQGLLEPYNWELIDRESKAPEQFWEDDIALLWGLNSTQMAYLEDTFPNGGPQNWADFWDVDKFPGPRGMESRPVDNIEFALMADGVPMEEVYPLTEEKIEQAFQKLDEIKPHVRVWWEQGAQSQQILADREVDVMTMWNGRATDTAVNLNLSVVQIWDQATVTGGPWAVVKGTPRAAEAMRFIDVATRPEHQAAFSRLLFYGPSHPDALEMLEEDIVQRMPTAHLDVLLRSDFKWWGEHLDEMTLRWNEWLLG